MANRKRQRGVSMVEVLVATTLSVMVVFTTLSVFLSGAGSWARGESMISNESDSKLAVRMVVDELREAMQVNVAADGLSVTYRLPVKDSSGRFRTPLQWDNVNRRIFFADGALWKQTGGTTTRLASHVILTDPLSSGGTQSYRLFTPNRDSIHTQLAVMVVTRSHRGTRQESVGRFREIVYFRNVIPVEN